MAVDRHALAVQHVNGRVLPRQRLLRPVRLLLCLPLALPGALGEAQAPVRVPHPEDFVNVLAGAIGGQRDGQHHSTGNTLPIVGRPWGFNHWSPQSTDEKTSWWFDGNADSFYGIRCTHQPSPWIGDYAWFLLRPYTGFKANQWMGFTSYHAEGALKPYLIDLTLGPTGMRVELTPTMHGAMLRVTFPASVPPESRKICAFIPEGQARDEDERRASSQNSPTGECHVSGNGIDLVSRKFSGGVPQGDFGLHARLEADGLRAEADHGGCFEKDFKWMPMDMPGQSRTAEEGPDACQRRCDLTKGCAHFVYWPDGGCHLQDSHSSKVNAGGLTTGPAKCTGAVRQCCFILGDKEQAEVKIGTSFISNAQALRVLDSEVYGKSFDALVDAGRMVWRKYLKRVEVLDAGPPTAATFRRLEVFYTSLYRALLFPRRLDEETPTGISHWSPYSGKVAPGIGVTDNGFWDTFRTVYPFLALAYPKELGQIVTGWLNAFTAGGWLPKWASPGYRDSMVGTFADVVLADAIIKNISGFDREIAWAALRQDAYTINPDAHDSSKGKVGLKHYTDRGFIPGDVGVSESCSRTLDFAFADAASAAAADSLGKSADAAKLRERSIRALKEMYDARNGLMGHKNSNNMFTEQNPETWGDCWTEGSMWHHSFPPFNVPLLAELHGGQQALRDKLHSLFTVPASYGVGSYHQEIHEMREMRMLGMGQYAHNNQPAHHLPYLFSMLGDHNSTAKLVRQILSRAYSPEGFAGDEDNGEMGSWYVLSAMGLYAPATGTTEDYVLGAVPLFPKIRLNDLDLTIEAPAAAHASPAISEVLWRTMLLPDASVPYSELRRGGVLRFMTPGDGELGVIMSAMRGGLHQAARRVRETAGASTLRKPPSSGLISEDVVLPKGDRMGPPTRLDEDEDDTTHSTGFIATVLLATWAGYRACCSCTKSLPGHTD